VTVVTAVLDGMLQAMTATAFSSVSLEPPLCLICVGKASRFHASVLHADRWAVSILAADQEELARHFAHSGRELSTQFDGVAHEFAPLSGAPLITGAAAWVDCLTIARHDAGDHTIVVGEIVWVADSDEERDRRPLTYHRGAYHRL
jgi:flavin reductase (DIM6/NTAB) family NADH-FMN oxidoreductase RutF